MAQTTKRPWHTRIWFWKPQMYFSYYWDQTLPVWKRLVRIVNPIGTGGDEYDWHTVVIGWTFTGRIIIATHPCRGTGKCKEYAEEFGLLKWPESHHDDWDEEVD